MIRNTYSIMKVYYRGRYYSENSTIADKEYLRQHAPTLYNRAFPRLMPTIAMKSGVLIYQTYYDERSGSCLDGGFIPYKTGFNHNYENDLLIEIWRKRDWVNAKYIGLLSWRFFEKTGLLSTDLKLSKDVTVIFPQQYEKYEHPFTRKGYKSVTDMAALCDAVNLFPFKLTNYPVKQNVWCNYWIAKPRIFDDYIRRYLLPAITFLEGSSLYDAREMHRGKEVFSMTFFLEGLFSIYLQEEKINYKVIKA